jgi:hypothetical protein
LAQGLLETLGDIDIVLNNQNAHDFFTIPSPVSAVNKQPCP